MLPLDVTLKHTFSVLIIMMNKNKNITPFRKCESICNVESDKSISYEIVINIVSNPWQNVLSDIVFLSSNFTKCVILYGEGNVQIFSPLPLKITDLLNKATENKDIKLKLETIGSWSPYYDTFLIYTKSEKEHLVLPKLNKTKHLFDLFNMKFCQKVVSVNQVDLLQYNNTHMNINSYDKELDKVNILKTSQIPGDKKSKASFEIRNVSLKILRKVDLPHNTKVKCVILPLSGEKGMNENYPQQVSEEQNTDGRSLFLFSNGLSLPVSTDNTSAALSNDYTISENNTFSRGAGSYTQDTEIGTGTRNTPNSAHGARHPDYINFPERLASYGRWIHTSPDPNTLCKAGFFYTNDGDLVRCFQCGIGLKDFSPEDDPLKEHVRHSGNCPYLVEVLGVERLSEWKRLLQVQDPELNRRMQWNGRNNITAGAYTYRHPEYQTREKRLETFVNWPAQMMQRPAQLADAGLFYTGFEDLVRCFACDGGLRRWDPDDDPWTEHCRWFPACPFARETKGDDYIALVQASANLESEGEAAQSSGQNLSEAMEQMTLSDPEIRTALEEHKSACLNMGYQITEFEEAVKEIRNRGTIKPSIEEIIDVIEVIQSRKLQDTLTATREDETPIEQNQRLKSYVICMKCEKNDVNALFLPCTHHRFCMKCAENVSNCPVCGKFIRQRIRTYMV